MSDDKKNTGSPDNKLINLHDPKEVWNWTKALGVTEDELREAVEMAGISEAKVRDYLENR